MKMKTEIDKNKITKFVEEVVKRFNPEKVILFGSYAYGKQEEGSDVDILLIMETKATLSKEVEIRMKVERNFPLDLIVMDSREIEKRIKRGDAFFQKVLESGEILYEKRKQGVV